MIIHKQQTNSDNFVITPSSSPSWNANVPHQAQSALQQAMKVTNLFELGQVLATEVAPPDPFGHPDLKRLREDLLGEDLLDTNQPATPWELMAWTNEKQHFWAVEQPVTRVYRSHYKPTPVQNGPSLSLIVVSDPHRELKLVSNYKSKISTLANTYQAEILWNPPRNKVIQKVTHPRPHIIFIGHTTYNSDNPNESGYLLCDGHLTPDDVRTYLGGQPVIVFIACRAAQYAPQSGGLVATPAMGFMPACLDRGAAAFIGPLWDIKVDGGLRIAERLLKHLHHPHPAGAGEAMRLTRKDALEKTPHDTTWAAFVVYQPPPPSLLDRLMIWLRTIIHDGVVQSVAGILLTLITLALAWLGFLSEVVTSLVETDPPESSIITCADGLTHTISFSESFTEGITLSPVNAIFIEPNIPSQKWQALTGNLEKLPHENKKFSYTPSGTGSDVVTFTFKVNKNDETSSHIHIDISSEKKGLCDSTE